MDKVTKINVEGHNYGFVAGQAVKGTCASQSADWVKTIVLPEGAELTEGMVVATFFLNTNSAGFSDPITIYSATENVYYYDPEMTQPVTLPPYEDCCIITYIGGTQYSYQAFPVAVINGVRMPICDSRGRPCGGPIWAAGDTIASLYLDSSLLMLHSTTTDQVQSGSTLPVTSGAVADYKTDTIQSGSALPATSGAVAGYKTDTVQSDNMLPVTSNAVAQAIDTAKSGTVIACASQVIDQSGTITYGMNVAVLGAYGYGLFQIILPTPSGYHREYVLSFQGSTGDSQYIRVRLNNIATSWVNTWSSDTFRVIGYSTRFKESDIVLEPTHGYTHQNGTNLYYESSGGNASSSGKVWNVTISCFVVKD